MRLIIISLLLCVSCMNKQSNNPGENETKPIRLITLDPGHFHSALVQKTVYPTVDSTVCVYAPGGNDLNLHLEKINGYNSRKDQPTNWSEIIYTGSDYFERMLQEKKGNVVVIAGNNKRKGEYILRSLENSLHVLADKPMAIDSHGFKQLKKSFETARSNNVLLYDIMTERFEITTILQRELAQLPEIFGTLEKGTPDNPAITKESIHHFYKYVSGNVLTRPAWFLDASQQGEGLVDVSTHLVDLVQWECFPEQVIDTTEIKINAARRWPTEMSLSQFSAITKLDNFPEFLRSNVSHDTILQVFSNGEINYAIRGIHAKTSVIWNYKAPEGTGDTHFSMMRGTSSNLVIRQGPQESYQPTLYIEPVAKLNASLVEEKFKTLLSRYPGISLKAAENGWQVVIPEKYKEGHEAHFARVTENFLRYLEQGNMPPWEVPNMIAKYYTTTKALAAAR